MLSIWTGLPHKLCFLDLASAALISLTVFDSTRTWFKATCMHVALNLIDQEISDFFEALINFPKIIAKTTITNTILIKFTAPSKKFVKYNL